MADKKYMRQGIFGLIITLAIAAFSFRECLSQEPLVDAFAGVSPEEERIIEWNGYVRGSLFGGSRQYDIGSGFGELGVRAALNRPNTVLFADLRVREGLHFDTVCTIVQLKEAYAGYRGRKLDITLGNQIIAWGRTDGFNPTGNLIPYDYFLLTAEPDDQKLSNLMLRTRYRLNAAAELDLVLVPFYKPSIYRYDLFDMGPGVVFEPAGHPGYSLKKGTLAARLNVELPAAGFSFSYFHGYDPFYGFHIKDMDLMREIPSVTYQPGYYSKNVLGADLELTAGSWIIRAEAAYEMTTGYREKMDVPYPGIYGVAGIERSLSGVTAILQYIGKFVIHYTPLETPLPEDPYDPVSQMEYAMALIKNESAGFNRGIFNQRKQWNHALFISLGRSFSYETIRAEFSAYCNITTEEYLLRPSLTWSITDQLSAAAGMNLMDGPGSSVFHKAKAVLNGGFFQLKVSF